MAVQELLDVDLSDETYFGLFRWRIVWANICDLTQRLDRMQSSSLERFPDIPVTKIESPQTRSAE
jgi:hypothetical protein